MLQKSTTPVVTRQKTRIGLFQRLAFLDSLQSIIHAVQNVANCAFARQLSFLVAFRQQGFTNLSGRKICVLARSLQFRIRMRVRFDNQANVNRQLRSLLLAAGTTTLATGRLIGCLLIGAVLACQLVSRMRSR